MRESRQIAARLGVDRPQIIDGGLATALEARGHVLHPTLWSAGVFLAHPQAVEQLHLDYIDAGAEIIIGASYQMSFEGLAAAGLDRAAATAAMSRTVTVARRASDLRGGRARVAASVGPYGAALADGSEYRGAYGLSAEQLFDYHRERFEVLLGAGPDLMAVETIPVLDEALALARLLAAHDVDSWISFSCCDGRHIGDGTPIERVAAELERHPAVRAIGVNCTAPEYVDSLIHEIRRSTTMPIVVYPNSGEHWDARSRCWTGEDGAQSFCKAARGWAELGVQAIGGCCRVGPAEISRLVGELR